MGGSSRRRCVKPRTAKLSEAQRAARPFPEVGVWEELPAEERALLSALALNEPGEMLRLPRQLRETFAAILLESSKSEPEIGMVWKLLDTFDKNRPAP